MKKIVVAIAILLLCTFPVFNEKTESKFINVENVEIINITVTEAWEMLQSEDDGVQIPVDVRTFQEYFTERIATPHFYDKPRLYPLQLIEKQPFTKLFTVLFKGKEIILYCRTAHRSYIAANLLLENNFEGTLYNMVGGITAWKAAGLPTVKGFGWG
ncbi:MAG: rhodanese-like domain-containing protein [Thermoplasmata archaeon]|nr:MAG: rhodanese-like domain-containing protein [Thermoplasmata archaeon]